MGFTDLISRTPSGKAIPPSRYDEFPHRSCFYHILYSLIVLCIVLASDDLSVFGCVLYLVTVVLNLFGIDGIFNSYSYYKLGYLKVNQSLVAARTQTRDL